MFEWTNKRTEWFLDASKYTKYHQNIAAQLTRFINFDNTVCDLGCGLGLISLQLSKKVKSIKCIDINPIVINNLQNCINEMGITNIDALCMDSSLVEETFDTLLLSFYGHINSQIYDFIKMANENVIIIVNKRPHGNLFPGEHKKAGKMMANDVDTALRAKNISFDYIDFALEFGQPFKSLDDSILFVNYHSPETNRNEIEEFLKLKLMTTGDEKFPYFLSNLKHVGVFNIKTNEIIP